MGGMFPSAAAAILRAAPAAAGANNYLQYLNDHGAGVLAFDDTSNVSYGIQACQMLHSGITADRVGSMVGPSDSCGILDAAEHELCAGTLQ
jgi:hypothetical protein